MQKITEKLKNTPRDVQLLLVPCSVSSSLNKVKKLSVPNKVRSVINSEGVRSHRKGSSDLRVQNMVFVLNMRGQVLMPTSQKKANTLLKGGKAKVVKRIPFTIQLKQATGENKQTINCGIDSGYQNIGFSTISKNQELISGTVKLDNKNSKRLTERKMYRRNRRNRLWYRKPRFNNRKRKDGWLPPSIQRRYDTHLNLISKLKNLLPISQVIVEVAKFDIQKIENPDIEGKDYQQGSLYEYQNIRSYLMARESGKCQLCGKKFKKGQPSHIHHCKQRNEMGSNRPENLAILHKQCHKDLHKKGLKLSKPKEYKANTFMSIIHKRFWSDIPNLKVTYGYETFIKRNKLNLKKSHSTDAFIIAGGNSQVRNKPFEVLQKHRHNRVTQLNRKGFKPSIKSHIYKIQPKDLVWFTGKIYTVIGIQNKGKYVKVENSKKVLKVKDIQKIYNFGGLVWNISSPT